MNYSGLKDRGSLFILFKFNWSNESSCAFYNDTQSFGCPDKSFSYQGQDENNSHREALRAGRQDGTPPEFVRGWDVAAAEYEIIYRAKFNAGEPLTVNMKNNLAITRCIQGVLFAYPILLLTVRGGMSASLILLVALSIYLLFGSANGSIRQDMDRDFVLFSLAMSATIISVLLSQLYHLDNSSRAFDFPSRFLFSIPIFFVLRNMDFKVIGILQYGCPAGAILIGAIIWVTGQKIYAHSSFAIHIHLGDMALMLGFLSIFSINWTQKDSHLLVGLKVLGLAAGLYVSLLSGARGGWAAIPVFFLVWVLMSPKFRKGAIARLSIATVVIVVVAVLSYYVINIVHIRVDEAISDLKSGPDTSLGIRFQLWGAAIHLFMQNPIFGVGANGFGLAMDGMSDSGVITRVAADIGKGEVHSYYFATLARFGLFGLASVLLLFFIPLWMFYKASKSNLDFHRVAARMGFALVLGFVVFCVTVEMFNLKMIASFYGVTLAVLLAGATNRRVEEATKHNDINNAA